MITFALLYGVSVLITFLGWEKKRVSADPWLASDDVEEPGNTWRDRYARLPACGNTSCSTQHVCPVCAAKLLGLPS